MGEARTSFSFASTICRHLPHGFRAAAGDRRRRGNIRAAEGSWRTNSRSEAGTLASRRLARRRLAAEDLATNVQINSARCAETDERSGALASRRLNVQASSPAGGGSAAGALNVQLTRCVVATGTAAGRHLLSRRDACAPVRSARFSRDPRRRDAAGPAGEDASVPY
jgi:hypothetical protein